MKTLSELRQDARAIFDAGVEAAHAGAAVERTLTVDHQRLQIAGAAYDLSKYDGIYVVGAGKAAAVMAKAMEGIPGLHLRGGVVTVKYGHAAPTETVKVQEAAHPVPDEAGLRGTEEIVKLLGPLGQPHLVFCLLSGGASALLVAPAEGLTLTDKQQTTELLLTSGATIRETNMVRKHLSQVKGGRLARFAYPVTLISLILSDVVDDDLEAIGSGPTVADSSTFGDSLRVLEKYGIEKTVPSEVRRLLESGSRAQLEETPKPSDPVFQRVHNVIVGSNLLSVQSAKEKAEALGYHALVLSRTLEGESRVVAGAHAAMAQEILAAERPVPRPACLISSGETSVTVRGGGLGGRNQEFALAGAIAVDGLDRVVIMSGGTDGTDGPTDAAGAVADGTTVRRAQAAGMDPTRYLLANDSYRFFKSLGDLLFTGPTLTNVMDLHLVLVA